MTNLKDQHQRPEGRLIEDALSRAPKVSKRQLATAVGMSEGRVRQIINGYKTEAGMVLEVVGSAETLARMASEAGVSSADMTRVGRADAAAEMESIRTLRVVESGQLRVADQGRLHEQLRTYLDEVVFDASTRPPTGPLMLWDFEQLVQAVMAKHGDEIALRDFALSDMEKVLGQLEGWGGDGDAAGDTGRSAPTNVPGSGPVSVADDRVSDLVAADEQETSISAEQEESDTP